MRQYTGLVNYHPNLLTAIDVETTGCMPGWHEIIQIAVQPLNSNIDPVEGMRPFYMKIAPSYPERAEREATIIHGLNIYELHETAINQQRAAEMFYEWYQQIDLPYKKSFVPLAHNWSFESGFLKSWLGLETFDQCFHPHPRDSMQLGIALNDRAAFKNEKPPFSSVSLTSMCRQLGIPIIKSHDALADALAEAKLYKALLQISVF